MDVTLLSRIQFGMTVGFHFIFVPLTIGLGLFIAIIETLYVRTNDPKYKALAKFWGKIFTINFVLGVVTGVTMEFQFGTNWSKYSEFMGDIFGSPLAVEALMAFFLESTFMGIWLFGWEKVSKKFHAFAAWMVAIGTHLSAIWIITANSFMQHPVGYAIENGRAVMTNFWAVLFNPYSGHMLIHTYFAGYSIAAFVVLGVCAYHFLRKQHLDAMKASFKLGIIFAVIAVLGNALTGHFNGQNVAARQPSKLAAMEAIWETQPNAGFSLFAIPGDGQNAVEILTIPGLASWLAYGSADATIKGLNDFAPDEVPPVGLTFWSFRVMIGLGVFMLVVALYAGYLYRKNKILESPRFLKLLLYMIPIPYIATNMGWMVAEVGRQPWTVFGLMRTADSVSPVALGDVVIGLGLIVVIYTLLIVLDIYLMTRYAKAGPALMDERQMAAAD